MEILTKPIVFILLNFAVSFVSDLVLNMLTHFGFLLALRPYFQNQSSIISGIVAGLTILFALFLTMFVSYWILGFIIPKTTQSLFSFCVLAFVIGYIIDKAIYIQHIFGNRLNAYYKEYGSGFWGATAFLFSIIISYFIQKIILKSI